MRRQLTEIKIIALFINKYFEGFKFMRISIILFENIEKPHEHLLFSFSIKYNS